MRGMFIFNSESGRFAVGTHDLHCGECFQILHGGKWVDVRIEMSGDKWYLVGFSNDWAADYEGFPARLYER